MGKWVSGTHSGTIEEYKRDVLDLAVEVLTSEGNAGTKFVIVLNSLRNWCTERVALTRRKQKEKTEHHSKLTSLLPDYSTRVDDICLNG